MAKLTYSRAAFDVPDEAAARRIILTPEFGQDTDERWERETPYLADLIGSELQLTETSLCIDYGCGIGRLSKALIDRYGCRVLGVDISERMRVLAPDYVQSQRFSVASPQMLYSLAKRGFRADAGLSVWVLQHCLNPAEDAQLLDLALSPQAPLFVLNMIGRAVPTAEGRWANDGQDVKAILDAQFGAAEGRKLEPGPVPPQTVDVSWWATFRG
jgi:2-polyprenyl-3-methyl-5-hydroxy-6-metoxy-1,4-benzoquinol methylase